MKNGFLNALGEVVYIVLIATFFQNANSVLGEHDNFLSPIIALTLLVLSATVTFGLILGRPLMLFLEDKKKEAVTLFLQTTAWFAGFTVLALMIGILINKF